jgi:hypothetical protein
MPNRLALLLAAKKIAELIKKKKGEEGQGQKPKEKKKKPEGKKSDKKTGGSPGLKQVKALKNAAKMTDKIVSGTDYD